MPCTLWLATLVWASTYAGENDDLSISGFPDESPTFWFSSFITGESLGQLRKDSTRSRNLKTFWSVKFLQDNQANAWISEKRGFGFFDQEINNLTLVAPISERAWLLDLLRIQSRPAIRCKLRPRSEGSMTDVVESYRLVSERRTFIREEAL
jgi:hypothetical protein